MEARKRYSEWDERIAHRLTFRTSSSTVQFKDLNAQVYKTHITPRDSLHLRSQFPFFFLIKLDRACIKAPLMQSLAMWRKINGRRNQIFLRKLQAKGNRSKGW